MRQLDRLSPTAAILLSTPLDDRRFGLDLGYPLRIVTETRLELPAAKTSGPLSPPAEVRDDFLHFRRDTRRTGGGLLHRSELELRRPHVPAAALASFSETLHQLARADAACITLP